MAKLDKKDLNDILDAVSYYTGIDKKDIVGKRKKGDFNFARTIYIWTAIKRTDHFLRVIGEVINRPHDVVIHHRNKMDFLTIEEKTAMEEVAFYLNRTHVHPLLQSLNFIGLAYAVDRFNSDLTVTTDGV